MIQRSTWELFIPATLVFVLAIATADKVRGQAGASNTGDSAIPDGGLVSGDSSANRGTGQSVKAFRSIDGANPSRGNPDWGAAGVQLRRWAEPAYGDGSSPTDQGRPNPRAVSQIVVREDRAIPNARNASSFLWQWGQFLDHDMDLTESVAESYHILVPQGDPFFDPAGTGVAQMPFFRSLYDLATGGSAASPRQQMNQVTAYIDASNVYGSDTVRAVALRMRDGTGRLRTSAGNLLPFNVDGLPSGGGPLPDLYLAGDVRANEQIGLTSMHVLFVREHNRLADLIRAANPRLSDEMIYQIARKLVGAEMQAITYREFLPLLLGRNALSPYRGYRKEVDPSIANMFSTVVFRVGHTMLNERLLRLLANGRAVAEGALPLAEAFFNPSLLQRRGALEALLRGFAAQRARAIDPFVVDAVRNFLFGAPGAGGFDLASLNIQRGRDHGLADYNSARLKLGLGQKTSFATISSDPEIQDRLETAYGSIDLIDPWVGGLAEDRWRDALVGEFFFTVLKKQFENLRDGDPFWYERDLDPAARQFIENLTLSRIIRLNTQIGGELPDDVFRARTNAPF